VHPALWGSVLALRYQLSDEKLPPILVAHILIRLFEALTLLHEDCQVAHTDISETNMLYSGEPLMLTEYEDDELRSPSPRKDIGGRFVYQSHDMDMPGSLGKSILCDFGSCVPLDDGKEHRKDIQPDYYRSPEIILGVP
jgi:serine/threonine protein kinase